jgi:hypothetical protein
MEARATALTFDDFVYEIAEMLPALLPQVRVLRTSPTVLCRRATATAEIYPISHNEAVVLLSRNNVVELHGTILFTTSALNNTVADLVGFFCGASVSTLSIYRHPGPKPKQRRRAPRWGDQVPMRMRKLSEVSPTRTRAASS